MFAMTNRSRLLLCRAGLLLLCGLPTLVVGVWLLIRSFGDGASARKVEWERELTNRLGLVAEMESISYPRWDMARLVGVKLLDPETRSVVAEASQVEVVKSNDGWQVAALQLAIEGSRLDSVVRTFEQRILRGAIAVSSGRGATHIALAPRDGLLRIDGQDQSLQQLGGEVELSEEGVKLAVQFRLAGASTAGEPVRFTAIRDRTQSPPQTQWQLETRGTALACRLVRSFLPALAHLGRDCEFNGVVQLGESPGGPRGQIAGTFTGVDLDSLVTEQFPHQLSGQAMVRIEQGLIEQGKLVELRGSVHAHGGTIGGSLVAAAAEHLRLSAPAASSGGSLAIPFRQLAIDFQLTGRSLTLQGNTDPTMAGVLIANAAGPILVAPPEHSVAATNLLRTLLPESELQVPAARQTGGLVKLLPVPEIVPTTAAPLSAHTPTRLLAAPSEPVQTAVRPPVLR
jgi:hypothetical protein